MFCAMGRIVCRNILDLNGLRLITEALPECKVCLRNQPILQQPKAVLQELAMNG